MASASLLMHAAVVSQTLPPAALTATRRWTVPARRWMSRAFLVSLIGDGVGFVLGQRGLNNLWVGYISTPASSALMLIALSLWQSSAQQAKVVRLCIPAYLGFWILAVWLGEDLKEFSVIAFPVHSLIVLIVSLWTLTRNSLETNTPVLQSDWFWTCAGLSVLVGTAAAVEPLMGVLLDRGQVAQAVGVLNFKAGLQVLALLAITVGMLCPVPTEPSGPSSSPAR